MITEPTGTGRVLRLRMVVEVSSVRMGEEAVVVMLEKQKIEILFQTATA
jgi:hypothetical protein